MCNNYEDQLQSVQDEMKAEKMKVRSLERELVAEKQTIDAQKKYIEELEKSVKDSAVEAETEVFHKLEQQDLILQKCAIWKNVQTTLHTLKILIKLWVCSICPGQEVI